MSIQLIIAPPAGGKTRKCVEAIQKVTEKDPAAEIQVIVPDRLQRSEWQRRLGMASERGGFIGTRIQTFESLGRSILERARDPRMLISKTLNRLCVTKAIQIASTETPLEIFEPIKEMSGFVGNLLPAFMQMRQGLVPSDYSSDEFTPEEKDVMRIYASWQRLKEEQGWISAADILPAAMEILSERPSILSECPLLIIDGFDEFQPGQLGFIKALDEIIPEIIITLPGEKETDRYVCRSFQDAAKTLVKALDVSRIVYLPPYRKIPPVISHITQNLFEGNTNPRSGSREGLEMIEVSTQNDEAREALRTIKRLIIRRKIRPNQCAIFVPDLNTYKPLLRAYGKEMGIPLTFQNRNLLKESPAMAALKSLLELPIRNWEPASLIGVFRTPFFTYFSPDELNLLELISTRMRVISGIREWEQAFGMIIGSVQKNIMLSDEDGEKMDLLGNDSGETDTIRLWKKLSSLFKKLTPPTGTLSRKEWLHWLIPLLSKKSELGFAESVGMDTYLYNTILKTLNELVQYEVFLELDPVTYEEFFDILIGTLDEVQDEEETSMRTRSVPVSEIGMARGKRFQAVLILGMAEGLFPKGKNEELVLNEDFRRKIRLPARDPQKFGLFLQALSRADSCTYLFRPRMEANGNEWEPSVFWNAILRTLSGNGNEPETSFVHVSQNMEKQDPAEAASISELLFDSQRFGYEIGNFPEAVTEEILRRKEYAGESAARMLTIEAGDYDSGETGKTEKAVEPTLNKMVHSPSSVNIYRDCPFRYFLEKILKLEGDSTPKPGMTALQKGSLLHRILQETFSSPQINDNDPGSVNKVLNDICDRILPEAPRVFLFRETPLWRYEKRKIRRTLIRTVAAMFAEETRILGDGWHVEGTEQKYGFDEMSGPEFLIGDHLLRFRGIIDRIDRKDEAYWRVIDYKTSENSAEKDKNLQIYIYAKALEKMKPEMRECEAYYWAINQNKTVGGFTYIPHGEPLPPEEKIASFANGVYSANFSPSMVGDHNCFEDCPASSWCPRFRERAY